MKVLVSWSRNSSGMGLIFCGVPCSLLGEIFLFLEHHEAEYMITPREDVAVGVAVGALLAGRRPCLLVQNTGFAAAINPLLTLLLPCKMPLLILTSWRGDPDTHDSEEHEFLGAAFIELIRSLEIPCAVSKINEFSSKIEALMKAECISKNLWLWFLAAMNRVSAIRTLAQTLSEHVFVFGNGLTSRIAFSVRDCFATPPFFMLGSMGLASAIGSGIAGANLPVCVVEGDGNFLMGAKAAILPPRVARKNFLHVVLDNRMRA
ncbi:MAG: hypothetical protein IPL62_17050 [Caulobacteraceae bacterium]|nr:hypothetical protein [Caulobacteraceae bacterium]